MKLDTFSFQDRKTRQISNDNWKKQCQVLKSAIWTGYEPANEIYSKTINRKKLDLDLVDSFYIDADVNRRKMIRAFWWEQLAEEREMERDALAKAYHEGKVVEKNRKRSRYWEELQKI